MTTRFADSWPKSVLEKHGFEAIVANGIPAAKDALAKRRPAMVLMDVHLGSDNGIAFVKSLRTASPWPDIPVIVVSSDRLKHTVLKAVDVNVQGYLLKPYQPDALVAKVREVLG